MSAVLTADEMSDSTSDNITFVLKCKNEAAVRWIFDQATRRLGIYDGVVHHRMVKNLHVNRVCPENSRQRQSGQRQNEQRDAKMSSMTHEKFCFVLRLVEGAQNVTILFQEVCPRITRMIANHEKQKRRFSFASIRVV